MQKIIINSPYIFFFLIENLCVCMLLVVIDPEKQKPKDFVHENLL